MGKGNGKSNGKPRRARKSKGEASTGAKENTVEMRTPSLNLQQVTLDDGDFDMHLKSVLGAVDKMKVAKNLYDGVCKAAKRVSPELLTAVKLAIKYKGMDMADVKAQLEIAGYVLKRQGSPVQLTIHDQLSGDVNKAAYEKGKSDALNGRTSNSPYPEGSDLNEHYATGFRNGIGSNLGLTEAETEAAVNGPEDGDDEDEDGDEDSEFAEVDEDGKGIIPAELGRRSKEPALTD